MDVSVRFLVAYDHVHRELLVHKYSGLAFFGTPGILLRTSGRGRDSGGIISETYTTSDVGGFSDAVT